MPDTPDRWPLTVRRLSDLEDRASRSHDKHHDLSNTLTELKMKTDLLGADHDTLKRDYWHGMDETKARSQRTADTAADIVKAQGDQLRAFEKLSSKQDSTERVLKWVLAVVTAVGTSTTVALLLKLISHEATV